MDDQLPSLSNFRKKIAFLEDSICYAINEKNIANTLPQLHSKLFDVSIRESVDEFKVEFRKPHLIWNIIKLYCTSPKDLQKDMENLLQNYMNHYHGGASVDEIKMDDIPILERSRRTRKEDVKSHGTEQLCHLSSHPPPVATQPERTEHECPEETSIDHSSTSSFITTAQNSATSSRIVYDKVKSSEKEAPEARAFKALCDSQVTRGKRPTTASATDSLLIPSPKECNQCLIKGSVCYLTEQQQIRGASVACSTCKKKKQRCDWGGAPPPIPEVLIKKPRSKKRKLNDQPGLLEERPDREEPSEDPASGWQAAPESVAERSTSAQAKGKSRDFSGSEAYNVEQQLQRHIQLVGDLERRITALESVVHQQKLNENAIGSEAAKNYTTQMDEGGYRSCDSGSAIKFNAIQRGQSTSAVNHFLATGSVEPYGPERHIHHRTKSSINNQLPQVRSPHSTGFTHAISGRDDFLQHEHPSHLYTSVPTYQTQGISGGFRGHSSALPGSADRSMLFNVHSPRFTNTPIQSAVLQDSGRAANIPEGAEPHDRRSIFVQQDQPARLYSPMTPSIVVTHSTQLLAGDGLHTTVPQSNALDLSRLNVNEWGTG